jgi:hypothetical protein
MLRSGYNLASAGLRLHGILSLFYRWAIAQRYAASEPFTYRQGPVRTVPLPALSSGGWGGTWGQLTVRARELVPPCPRGSTGGSCRQAFIR